MEKISLNNLIIEVTRKCNMSCMHCLRGNAENKNIDTKYIDSLLSQVDYISSITFSGGEPSLNVESIEYFIKKAKELNVSIGNFYIATNGKEISERFVITCLKLYAMADDKDMCSIEVSNDQFHADEGSYNTELLDGLSFFRRKFSEEQYDYNYFKGLISEGRAKNITDVTCTNDEYLINTKNDFSDYYIYLNCKGEIINGCDWSYLSQTKHKLCNIDELTTFYAKLTDD